MGCLYVAVGHKVAIRRLVDWGLKSHAERLKSSLLGNCLQTPVTVESASLGRLKMTDDESFEVADPSGLSDADWAEINKLKRAYETGGKAALGKAFDDLSKDPIAYVRVLGAFYPDEIRESIKDAMAEQGISVEDLQEIVRKLESPARRDQ